MQYFRAAVAYDGTDFQGFQLQGHGRTVQGVLETALAELTGSEVRVVGSGRTDAGVHARGQVVGFTADWRHGKTDLHRAMNALLPSDVVVTSLGEAPPGWHPRFSARWRHYRYSLLCARWRSPLEQRYSHHTARPVSLALLQEAAEVLAGEHDFASFGQPMRRGQTTVRVIMSATWTQLLAGAPAGSLRWDVPAEGDPAGPVEGGGSGIPAADVRLQFDVVGNAFLRGMVRSLVGAMLKVGVGDWSVAHLIEVLDARDRALAAPPAPACGLCLMHVEY